MHTSGNSSIDTSLIRDIYCGPEVLFETCVAMKFVDDDDDKGVTPLNGVSRGGPLLPPLVSPLSLKLRLMAIIACSHLFLLVWWLCVCCRPFAKKRRMIVIDFDCMEPPSAAAATVQ